MSETLVERLARRWIDAGQVIDGYESAEWYVRWWLEAIADEVGPYAWTDEMQSLVERLREEARR